MLGLFNMGAAVVLSSVHQGKSRFPDRAAAAPPIYRGPVAADDAPLPTGAGQERVHSVLSASEGSSPSRSIVIYLVPGLSG